MKLRTDEQFLDYLDREFVWRLREISMMKAVVRSKSNGYSDTLMRAGIPLLYAHWEGFVKAGVEAVLCFVSLSGKTYGELAPCFAVHGLKATIDELTEPKKVRVRIKALEFLMGSGGSKVAFDWKNQVSALGNLNFERFSDIAAAVGVDVSRYDTRKQFVDTSLVQRRNAIAHGARIDLNVNGFISDADEVLVLLQWFKGDLEDCISHKSYLAVG